MHYKKTLFVYRVLPVIVLEVDRFWKIYEQECCIHFGPFLITRSDSHCGDKKSLGVCYIKQFYRTLGLAWLLKKLSPKLKFKLEIDVQVCELSSYQINKIYQLSLSRARYLWEKKKLKSHYSVQEIQDEILSRFSEPLFI